jgi:hypothetical protein
MADGGGRQAPAFHCGGLQLSGPIPPKRPWWLRLLMSVAAGAVFALLVAIGLTGIDLYLSGHGKRPVSSPWLNWPAAGIHLSLADVIFLGAAVLGAAVTWRRTARGGV